MVCLLSDCEKFTQIKVRKDRLGLGVIKPESLFHYSSLLGDPKCWPSGIFFHFQDHGWDMERALLLQWIIDRSFSRYVTFQPVRRHPWRQGLVTFIDTRDGQSLTQSNSSRDLCLFTPILRLISSLIISLSSIGKGTTTHASSGSISTYRRKAAACPTS